MNILKKLINIDGHESPELSKGYNNSLPVQQPAVNQRRRMTVTQLFKKVLYNILYNNIFTKNNLNHYCFVYQSEPEPVRAYDIVPHMRPILFVGPSLKGFDVYRVNCCTRRVLEFFSMCR